jgi:putative endonuclease
MKDTTTFFYVYILHSDSHPNHFYSGFTTNIEERLKYHNAGHVPSTKPYRPWRIKTCVAFDNEAQAKAFESYLKTQSGRAFAKKRL